MQEKFMKMAIKQAMKAVLQDEVPIGAVIVKDGVVLSRAYNLVEKKQNPTAHAEMLAIAKACKKMGSWRLDGAEMYVTMEPCPMCAGAIVNARISKVYFGAYENKSGGAVSKFSILTDSGLNHKTQFEGGILQENCANIIKNYFKGKRRIKSLD